MGQFYYTPIANAWELGDLKLFHILYGEDDFSIRESLAKTKADCGGADLGEANAVLFEGSKVSLGELTAACNTISFLAPKRLVIVEGLLSRFESKAKSRRGRTQSPELKEWVTLAEHVTNMPESTVLVLVDGKLTKANPLMKKLAPVAKVTECVPPKGTGLNNWIRARIAANGGEISPQAMRLLTDLIGNNLWVLSNEVDKLCLHAGNRRIEEDDVNSLVSYAKESNVFAMVDAIVQRRLGVASRLMHQLLDEGSAPPYLLYMITRQFRLLIQAKRLLAQRVPLNMIGSKIGETMDWKLEKTLEQARGYSIERLENTYRKLLDVDLSIKKGALEGELALDLLITELCGG
ncbi:MAG: DNA polymerase III subunit delta [Chloroflexi bacterium CG07_land_8_20_14_0_80_51_10]|nr:MAG: DNA polymerase III subunit delta [Chloroflexi bacterium CG07_land_8_20_14_0_80_51_10]